MIIPAQRPPYMNPHPVRIYGAQGTLGTIEYTEEVNTGLLSSVYICVSQDTVSELMEMNTNIYRKLQAKKKKSPILLSTYYMLGIVLSRLHAHVNVYT